MEPTGLDRFVEALETHARRAAPGLRGTIHCVHRMGEECAYICLRDLRRPSRFLRQMAGAPPVHFGVTGFDPRLVDDQHPVRHYVAFVVTGFWLPALAALLVLFAWEVLGFFRYGGEWSRQDLLSGMAGLRHGRAVRRHGPWVLPHLVRRDLEDAGAGASNE